MKYKLAGEDEHLFHIQHPDGSTFSIAKSAVGPGVHKQIKKLESIKMADGGEVPDDTESEASIEENKDQEMRPPISINSFNDFKNMLLGNESSLKPAESQDVIQRTPSTESSAPILPNEQNVVVASPQNVPSPQNIPGNMSDAVANAFAQKESGITGIAAAQEKAAKAQANVYAAQVAQMAKSQAHYEQASAALDAEHKQLTDAVMNDKIDPNRLYHNMGTGNKIIAAISVALGGIGAGLQGHGAPNMALGVIQKSIDRDIEAQKLELGKKQNLLSENLRRTGNLNTATQMTQLQMNAITQAKIAQIAAQSGSAQSQAQAKMLLGDLGLQSAQIKQQLALSHAQAQSLGYGGNEGGLPVGQEPFQMLSDPKYQAKRVLVNGRAYQHTGKEEAAQDFRNVESVAGGITDLVKQLDAIGPSATVPGSAENNKAQAIRYQLSTEIPKLKSMQIGAKRVNDTEAERAEHMISDPTKFGQLLNGGVRNEVFFKTLEDELERARRDNLIGYKGKAQYKSFKPGI